jgi:alpha-galactosidase
MIKIAFIGAGSLGFTSELFRDILTLPLLEDAHIAMMDINSERLEFVKRAVTKLIEASDQNQ